jgi:serine protease Do
VLSGLTVQDLTPELRGRLGVDGSVEGVIISRVDPASLAAEAGFAEGDVIVSINRVKVGDVKAYKEVTAKLGEEEPVLLLISRKGSALWVSVGP